MFHVERTPIEKPSPLARPALNELMAARLNHMDRQQRGQLDTVCSALAIDSPLETTVLECDTDAPQPQHRRDFGEYRQPGRAMADKPAYVARAERSSPAQEMDGLEEARLAGPVRTVDEVTLRAQREIGFRETAERRDSYAAKRQRLASLVLGYSRIGITTNFVRSPPGSRIKQLEFASVTPTSTCSLSTAANASSK